MRFRSREEFWVFVGQFSEARTYALKENSQAEEQLQNIVTSFRALLVVGCSMNAQNQFDAEAGREIRPRFGDDVPAGNSDSEGDE